MNTKEKINISMNHCNFYIPHIELAYLVLPKQDDKHFIIEFCKIGAALQLFHSPAHVNYLMTDTKTLLVFLDKDFLIFTNFLFSIKLKIETEHSVKLQ